VKTILSSFLFCAIFLIGCADDSSFLTSSESEFTQQSTSPNWVKLPNELGQGFSVETEYSADKLIKGDDGGVINLFVKIKRPGHEFGDFKIKATVKVEMHSFPDDEEWLFTITIDPENTYLNISPSPNTLYKHITVDWLIEGIDVSDINPDTFDFIYVGDNNEILETSKQELTVDYIRHKIKVRKCKIDPTTTEDTPEGTRYGFTR